MRKFRAIIEFETTERNFDYEMENHFDKINEAKNNDSKVAYLDTAVDNNAVDITLFEIEEI